WLDLELSPEWRGTVVEIGVFVFATDASDKLSISGLTLHRTGWRGVLASYWSAWTSYRGWSARSINYLYGTADPNALSPVLVAAAWSALAVVLLWLAGLLFTGVGGGALAVAVVLPWVALDLLWQKELLTQLAHTRAQFSGKTVAEKHLADADSQIYSYIVRLKSAVLPTGPSRIVILHNSRAHNFDRLKAQYYLLPNNVYNFGKVPPESGMAYVDYVLVLGEVPGLEFHPLDNTLVWQHGRNALSVELLDSDPLGNLYRVTHRRTDLDEHS
ncbi:MAG: hypothetical protein R3E50_00005, partial [Halioglobus sp.]